MVTQRQSMDHTKQGRDRSQKAPHPQVSGLCATTVGLSTGTRALCSWRGRAKRHMRSCVGQPGWGPSHPSGQASGKGAAPAPHPRTA